MKKEFVSVNFFSFKRLQVFNDVLTQVILRESKRMGNVGVHLSAGKDTRSILSILLNNHVTIEEVFTIKGGGGYTCNLRDHYKDREIAEMICNDLDLPLTIVDVDGYGSLFEYNNDFDGVVFSGWCMSEFLDRGFTLDVNNYFFGETPIGDFNQFLNKYNVFVPILDRNVMWAGNAIPDIFKVNGLVNKFVIKQNYKELLNYEFKID